MKILFIVNEAPYGSEKTYDALRLAMALQKDQPDTEALVFLMADAVTAALPTQSTPQGFYNVERMVKSIINKGGQVALCGACCEARGIKDRPLLEGAEISTMSQKLRYGQKKGQGNCKNGNNYLARAFVEAANFDPNCSLALNRFYLSGGLRRQVRVQSG